jgi:hypothetical protein
MSLDAMKRDFETQAIYSMIKGQAAKVQTNTIKPKKILDYYRSCQEKFIRPRRYLFRRIILTSSKYLSSIQGLRVAQKIVKDFNSNPSIQNFEKLRQKYNEISIDEQEGIGITVNKMKGCRYFLDTIEWYGQLQEAAVKLKQGQISLPVLLNMGGGNWQINLLYLQDYKEKKVMSYKASQPFITRKIQTDITNNLFKKWTSELLKSKQNYWWIEPKLRLFLSFPPKQK